MKKIISIALIMALMFIFTACNSDSEIVNDNTSTTDEAVYNSSSDSVITTASALELTDGKYDLSFTKRDCNYSYDESTACKISFISSGAVVDSGSGATVDGNKVVINSEGVYILSGEISDGQILVNASDNDKIQLVLNNLNITSKTSPLIVQNADKVFITIAENTENTISDASSYELTVDDSTVDAAIFSKADLTINGSGTLNINGNYKHAVVSKDDLVITGGKYNIKSVSSAVDGKDCVKIQASEISINSGGDGIRSTNTDETDERGFVYIANGIINIECANDAIQASSLLRIDGGNFDVISNEGSENGEEHTETPPGGGMRMEMFGSDSDSSDTESAKGLKAADTIKLNGGTFKINSSDDAVHSNNEIIVSNGSFTISTGDDGFHADNTLTIDNGTINITESYEGIEAGEITVNGGNISVTSSDDGFNAAGGSDDSDERDYFSSSSAKSLTINGGYIYVDAKGDGVDSNGTISITGGITLVNGPSDNGNAAIDYNTSAEVSGGVLVALGSSGMAESVSGNGQGVILDAISSQSAETSFALCDSDGNVIVSLNSAREFNCVTVSAPGISKGETYKLVCGGKVENSDANGYAANSSISGGDTIDTVEMTSETYSNVGFGGMGMNGGDPGMNGGGMGGMAPDKPGRR